MINNLCKWTPRAKLTKLSEKRKIEGRKNGNKGKRRSNCWLPGVQVWSKKLQKSALALVTKDRSFCLKIPLKVRMDRKKWPWRQTSWLQSLLGRGVRKSEVAWLQATVLRTASFSKTKSTAISRINRILLITMLNLGKSYGTSSCVSTTPPYHSLQKSTPKLPLKTIWSQTRLSQRV